MPSNDTELIYCSLCDVYFSSQEERAIHIRDSEIHPSCDKCDRNFSNIMSLRNHLTTSPMHNYCTACEIDYMTAGGLLLHIEYSPIHAVHRRDGDQDTDHDDEVHSIGHGEGWEDLLGPSYFPEEEVDAARRRGDLNLFYEAPDHSEVAIKDLDIPNHSYNTLCKALDNLNVAEEESSGNSSVSGSPHLTGAPVYPNKLKPLRPAYICPLCLEIPNKCTSTKCGHAFCTSCLARSLMVKPFCPMCRTVVMPGQLRNLLTR